MFCTRNWAFQGLKPDVSSEAQVLFLPMMPFLSIYGQFISILVAAIGLTNILTLKGQLIELEGLLDSMDVSSSSGIIKPGE